MLKPGLYLYNGIEYRVLSCALVDGMYRVETNKRTIECAKDGLKNFLPVAEERQPGVALVHFVEESNAMTLPLSDVLMETITKLKTNKDYIDQARAINETAKNLIDLKRAQIEAIKLLRG